VVGGLLGVEHHAGALQQRPRRAILGLVVAAGLNDHHIHRHLSQSQVQSGAPSAKSPRKTEPCKTTCKTATDSITIEEETLLHPSVHAPPAMVDPRLRSSHIMSCDPIHHRQGGSTWEKSTVRSTSSSAPSTSRLQKWMCRSAMRSSTKPSGAQLTSGRPPGFT